MVKALRMKGVVRPHEPGVTPSIITTAGMVGVLPFGVSHWRAIWMEAVGVILGGESFVGPLAIAGASLAVRYARVGSFR